MKNNITRKIKCDCFKAMAPAWILNTIETVLTGFLSVYITTLVAGFTDAIMEHNFEVLTSEIFKIILCVFVSVFIFPLTSYVCNMLMLRQALKHDRKIMEIFLRKKFDKAMEMSIGEAQSRIENDPNNYRIEWMEMMTQIVSLPIILSYLLYSTWRLHWQYALIIIAISLIRIVIPIAVRKLNAKYDEESRSYETELRKCETDITSQPHYTVMLGIKEDMLKRMDALFWSFYKKTGKRRAFFTSTASFFTSTVDTVSWMFIIVIGTVFVSKNLISTGTVAAMLGFTAIYDKFFNSVIFIIKEKPIMKTLLKRMLVLYADVESPNGKTIQSISKISVENLSYKYNGNLVFEPLSFSFCSGEHIAICGENGSGKSTLLRILCGLNCHYTGNITIDDTDLSSISLDSWRNQIALATQDPFLFSGTVLENLTFGGLATEKEAMRVLENMGIAYLANRNVSIKQDSLSVGEKQRISLARAILKKAPIIFLDEPNNHLDKDSSQRIKDFIRSSKSTIVYISHTDSLTTLASRVIMVKKAKR